MPHYLKPFLLGILCTIAAIVWWALSCGMLNQVGQWADPNRVNKTEAEEKQPALVVSPDTVVITALPSSRVINGTNVAFSGKARYSQKIVGRYAKNITIVAFQATGENAYKSTINITWEDGSIEIVPAGTADLKLSPEKRAREIIVQGYSVHERKVFRDSSRDGVLNWEIRYEPVE